MCTNIGSKFDRLWTTVQSQFVVLGLLLTLPVLPFQLSRHFGALLSTPMVDCTEKATQHLQVGGQRTKAIQKPLNSSLNFLTLALCSASALVVPFAERSTWRGVAL